MHENKRISTICTYFLPLLFCSASLLFSGSIHAQESDTANSAKKLTFKSKHSPAKAVLYSSILPGLGQAYNHKYWKIPIVYAALGTATYFIISNGQLYNTYKTALITRDHGGIDPYPFYSSSDLAAIRDYYHRYRDLSFIAGAVVYVLNIVDAEVDAQLFTFNVNDDISMHITPQLNAFPVLGNVALEPSLSLVFKLK